MMRRLFYVFLRIGALALLVLCSAPGSVLAQPKPPEQQPGAAPPGVPPTAAMQDDAVPLPSLSPGPQAPPQAQTVQSATAVGEELQPFGAKLFMGNFLRAREDGLNPDYVIMPGDRVQVHTWGALRLSSVLVVDGQGNVFLPEVGPIRLAGVRNADLTDIVRKGLQRIYARNFDVYTNLITAKPVAVFVTGGVNRPGRYAGVPSDSILFFLDQAGGIDPKLGSYRKINVIRGGTSVTEADLYDFILKGRLDNPQFKDGDTILVGRRGPVVELRGDVETPALIEFKEPRPTGAQALAVIPSAARATEVTVTGLRSGAPFSHTLSVRDFSKFELRHGDAIELRDDGRAGTILVNLEGEFQGSSLLAVRRGARLVDVLNYIPIRPDIADPNAVHLKRPSVARAQKDSIDDSLFRLERSALLALSSSRGESEIRVKEAEMTQRFVQRARLIQPLGRVVTSYGGIQQNIVLEEGDIIVIPARTNVVRVGGEVLMAQAVLYQPGLAAEDYIKQAGGYTDRSETNRVIVLHANAQITIGDEDMNVRPGDEILVPPRVDTKEVQNILDITQIIYQIAISAAVVLAL